MDLTPEERRKIYEEEKARMEADKQAAQNKGNIPLESSTTLEPRLAAVLCYLGVWITGIIFLVIEQKNKWVRFHAAQSLVTFGALFIASGVLGWIPFIGPFFKFAFSVLGIIFWIVLMVKAYNGETYKVPWAGDLAEMIVGRMPEYHAPPKPAAPTPDNTPTMIGVVPPAASAYTAPPPPPPPPAAPAVAQRDEKTRRKIDDWFSHRREGRITGSAFAIAWCVILLVFFNFFNQYVAYYSGDTVNGVIAWTRQPFFTDDIHAWLPILNTALAVSIIAHIVMIMVDNRLLRQALNVIMTGFGLATVITLLVIFPFDFSVIPNHAAETGTNLGVNITLIIIAVGMGIGLLVGFIQLLVSSVRAMIKAE